MNKKLQITEIVGNMGVVVISSDSPSQFWHNGVNVDVTKTTTNIQLDAMYLDRQFQNYLLLYGPRYIEDQLQRLVKEKIRFDMVSWMNDNGVPEVTCQLFYGDKLIDEKTTLITKEGTQNVASPT